MGISLAALIVLGIFVLIAIRMFRGDGRERQRLDADEESRLVQEIHRGLLQMERRVEALETILFDRLKEGRSDE
ncbi:MAG: phage-shock protein [Deltaproteobacteria bacterium]|nr:MAG: phage-shock protein [Deltaproteobacteria bacterium]